MATRQMMRSGIGLSGRCVVRRGRLRCNYLHLAGLGVVCIAHNILKLAQGETPSIADAAAAWLREPAKDAPRLGPVLQIPIAKGIKQTGS